MPLPIIKNNYVTEYNHIHVLSSAYYWQRSGVVSHANKTLYVTPTFTYWEEKGALLVYNDNGIQYCNSTFKSQFNWEKTFNQLHYKCVWEKNDFFKSFIINLNDIKFKSVKERRESITKFKTWLINSNNLQSTPVVTQ